MAQQVTTDSSSLIDSIMQTSKKNYTDSGLASKFDSIYNKTIEMSNTSNFENAPSYDTNMVSNNSYNNNKELLTSTENNLGNDYSRQNITPKDDVKQNFKENDKKTNEEVKESETVQTSKNNDNEKKEETSDTKNLEDNENSIKSSIQEVVQSMVLYKEDNDDSNSDTEVLVETINVDTLIDTDNKSDDELNVDDGLKSEDILNSLNIENTDTSNTSINDTTINNVDVSLFQDNIVNIDNKEVSNKANVTVNKDLNVSKDVINTQQELNKNNSNLIDKNVLEELNVTIEDVSYGETNTSGKQVLGSIEQVVKNNIEEAGDNKSKSVNLKDKELDEKETLSDASNKALANNLQKTSSNEKNDNTVNNSEKVDEKTNTTSAVTEKTSSNKQFGNDSTKNKSELHSRERNVTENVEQETADFDLEIANDMSSNFHTDSISNHSLKQHIGGIHNLNNSSQAAFSQQTLNTNTRTNIINQIYNKLQTLNNTTNSKISMVLNPESLGKVSVQLINSKSGITAEMIVNSMEVKELLEENINSLKETLSAQGVQVNNVSIKLENSQNNTNMDYTEQENSNSNNHGEEKRQNEQKDKKQFEQLFSQNIENEEQEQEIN